jgi:hypothetical protein
MFEKSPFSQTFPGQVKVVVRRLIINNFGPKNNTFAVARRPLFYR